MRGGRTKNLLGIMSRGFGQEAPGQENTLGKE